MRRIREEKTTTRWLGGKWMMVLACIAVVSSSLAQENLTALIKKVSPSVVLVITYDEEGEELSGGSGFFISEAGDVITNRHVIQGAYHAEVKTADEKVYDVKEVLAEDKEGDLIRLSVDIPRDAVHVLGISDSLPEVGERVIVVGNPLGLEQTVSDGIVSAVREIPAFGNIIQITAPISSGSSGSPVVNMKGKVIGVASFQMVEGQNLNFAIPGERVTKLTPGKGQTLAERKAAITEEWVSSAEGLYWKGVQLVWAEDYQKALFYFKEAVKKNQQDAEAWFYIGYCKGNLGRVNEAIDAFKQAIRIDPEFADVYYNLGVAYDQLGRWSEAVPVYKQAIQLEPDYFKAYVNLGLAYTKLGAYQEGIETLKRAIRINSNDALAYFNLGWSYEKLGRNLEAINAYKETIRINPDDADAYINLGNVYFDLGRYNEALDTYKQAIVINPISAPAYRNLSLVYSKIGRYQEAIETSRQAILINPNYAEAYYDLGLTYGKLKLWDEAIEPLKQAIRIKPDDADFHYLIGVAYIAIGDKTSALQEYKILKELDSGWASQLFNFIYP
jgi:tetratricopeptide (TPR) repeat protein